MSKVEEIEGVGPAYAEKLAAAGINVEMINTSELRVNVVVNSSAGERALACLKERFAKNLL